MFSLYLNKNVSFTFGTLVLCFPKGLPCRSWLGSKKNVYLDGWKVNSPNDEWLMPMPDRRYGWLEGMAALQAG